MAERELPPENLLAVPGSEHDKVRRASSVYFNIPESQGREDQELGVRRVSVWSFLSSVNSGSSSFVSSVISRPTSRLSISTIDFKNTIRGIVVMMVLVFSFVILVVVFLFWWHIVGLY